MKIRNIAQYSCLCQQSVDGSKERPHFYVYCSKPCNSVQVGKLRVRCAVCKQGALTVHRDPCNWQDVLNKGQVGSYCCCIQL